MCQIDNGDGDICGVWRETWRRAAKAHRCSCCAARIEAGELYLQHFSVYDGDASPGRLCCACYTARQEFSVEHGTTLHPTMFLEILRDCEGEEATVDDDGITAPGRWASMLEAIRARYEAAPQTLSEGP